MKILDRIKVALSKGTIYNEGQMRSIARFANSKQGLRLTAELLRNTDSLTKKDIADWRQAWQMAINVDDPKRAPLYDIYQDCMADLTGAVSQRKGMTMKENFRLVGKDGKENEEATRLLQAEWFNDFLDLALDSRFWGHSLIELGDIVRDEGGMRFDCVRLVPRKHVISEKGVIVRQQGDDWREGIPYREGDFSDWCVEVGKPDDLGLLLKCAPSCISKKNMLGFWDMFGEIFGAPMRVAKATTVDDKERAKIESALENMGAAFWGLFPDGTDIQIVESSRGDAYNVYDRRVDRCNSELSKGILNQTMTIDSGSSLSQSETHLEVFENVVKADKRMLFYVINGRLLPLMAKHGFPVKGCTFQWDETTTYSPAELREFLRVALQYYKVPKSYFEENFGIPIEGERELPSQQAMWQAGLAHPSAAGDGPTGQLPGIGMAAPAAAVPDASPSGSTSDPFFA